ncbi:hypothetical protein [Paenibacillus tengchongensis]|uniref:hypothetical protein n=1 Tax=Paenibacillus tengchongensis TaxID=2608684 RepID=UPI00124E0091|nr:hypothetical protein [Paenibacillus tengchongensis]
MIAQAWNSRRRTSIILLAVAPDFAWALVSVLALGTLQEIAAPVHTAWLNRRLESGSRATVLSMVSGADALGQAAGGPAVGWIGTRFSLRVSLLAAGVLLVPVAALCARGMHREK